ncbi:MAG: flagellar assembly protein FliH [Methylococcales bacterium]|nr:flagellar assembly protein FliH [Methylococcales bacterium]
MSSSNRPRFSATELESLRLWATPYFDEDSRPQEIIEPEIIDEPEPPAPTLTVEEIEAIQRQAQAEGFALGKQEGYQAGFVEGSKKGYDENVHLIEVRTTQLVSLLEAFATPFKHLDESVERALADLAVKIAKQILHREIELDSGQVTAAVKAAVAALPMASQNVKLYLNPEDAELVSFNLGLDDSPNTWTIIEDASITRGGCKVETEISYVDATVENRLNTVLESMFGEDFVAEDFQ